MTAEGKTQFFDVRLSPVLQDGEVVSVLSSSNNVTGHEFAERALHRLATSFSVLSGEEFFYQVTKCFCETLEMTHAFVGELKAGSEKVSVVGGSAKRCWSNGKSRWMGTRP